MNFKIISSQNRDTGLVPAMTDAITSDDVQRIVNLLASAAKR